MTAGAVVLVVVAGLLVVPRVLPGLFPGGGPLGGAPSPLTVTGTPPDTAGSWASGVKEVWRNRSLGDASPDLGDLATKDGWGAVTFGQEGGRSYLALDPATGALLWKDAPVENCADGQINALVPCMTYAQGNDNRWSVSLVDWRSGQLRESVPAASLGVGFETEYMWQPRVIDGVLYLVALNYPDAQGEDMGRLGNLDVIRFDGGLSKQAWHVKFKGCDDSDMQTAGASASLGHGVLMPGFGLVLDASSGRSLLPDGLCGRVASEGFLQVRATDGQAIPPTVSAPDGTVLRVMQNAADLHLSGKLSPVAFTLSDPTGRSDGQADQTAQLMAVDPATGSPTWSRPQTVKVWMDNHAPRLWGGVWYDGERFIVSDNSSLTGYDAASGRQLWTRQLNLAWYGVQQAADGTLLASTQYGGYGLDPATGATLWVVDGAITTATGPEGHEDVFATSSSGRGFAARLVPADRLDAPRAVPADAPACPSGMTALSWTQYSDGSILLCRADTRYVVVFGSHGDWQASTINFSGNGYQVGLTDGRKVDVSLGGALVSVDAQGTVQQYPATRAWNNVNGEIAYRAPADVKSCPAGSWPISLSTFNGGWLLVCGTSAAQVTAFYYSDAGTVTEGKNPTYSQGGYCADSTRGRVCAYSTPALIAVGDNGEHQQSVTSNYFDGLGQGGAGQGTGSYGVNAPTADAKDQVRYLTEILQKSSAGRSSLEDAVSHVKACTSVSEAVTALQGVTANRQELLTALASTPVDAVPDGASLVASLRAAIEKSYASDQVWVQWAQSMTTTCVDPMSSPLYAQVQAMNESVAVAKDAFVSRWNVSIAPQYGAPTFTTSQI